MRAGRRLALVAVAAFLAIAHVEPVAAAPGQRVDLRVLLLSADGREPSFLAWEAALRREGVPFDTILATTAPAITADTLAEGTTHARYQAVVLATGGLVFCDAQGCGSALSPEEWTALEQFEVSYGIRQVAAFAYPSPQFGLNSPTTSGELGGTVASVTTEGAGEFPYLVGPVPIDTGTYGYLATPAPGANFRTLVEGPGQSSLIGVYTHPDGREEMVVTFDSNPGQLHSLLLSHGELRWATRGVFLGFSRNYLTVHVDDIFLANDRWNPVTNTTPDPSPNPIRITDADASAVIAWSQANGLRLDFAFNGNGSVQAIAENGSDPLTRILRANAGQFTWINHTFTHLNLDSAGSATIRREISQNRQWAQRNGIPIRPNELITGDHSGLSNPAMPGTLSRSSITRVASDASRTPQQTVLGPALTVPRHPSNIYYNTATQAEQLDEYNYIYFENCTPSPTTTCFTQPATWGQYVDSEARIMLGHVLTNDPRPHFVHQSNLAEDRILLTILDEVLRRYRSYLNTPLDQPTMTGSGDLLSNTGRWNGALGAGQVTAYTLDGNLFLQSSTTTTVPVTGTTTGTLYGGDRSAWVSVPAGTVIVLPLG